MQRDSFSVEIEVKRLVGFRDVWWESLEAMGVDVKEKLRLVWPFDRTVVAEGDGGLQV